MSETDQYLIDQFRTTGQVRFLEVVLQRHLPQVRRVVYQMVLDHDAADDVTQDVFLRVMKGLDRFEGRSEFSTWLVRIAMNTAHTFLAKRSRTSVQFCDELLDVSTDRHCSPEGLAVRAEVAANIRAALETLSPSLRAAIVLVCMHGRSASEAAEIEDCSTDTMYWRVHEARRQLKQLLANDLT
ncbi:MAG: RNA polymerase sigma factor [Planctomycetaceae bacterium]